MSIFDRLSKTFAPRAKAPSLEVLEGLGREAVAALEAAKAALAVLANEKVGAILAGDAARAEHRMKVRDAEADIADAEAALAIVRERLAQARLEVAEAGRRDRYAAAVAAQKTAQAALLEKYGPAVAELRRLQGLVADADALADVANADLPQGADRLTETEAVRDVPATPERILKEEADSQWVAVATGTPIDPSRVTRRQGHMGVTYAESHVGPRPIPCELIEVRRVTREPWAPPVFGARLASMVLPDLKAEPLPPPAAVTEIVPLPPPVAEQPAEAAE